MKKTIKGYVYGFLSAALLISSIGYAASTTTLYNVLMEGVKIVVDGTKINPTDANGNSVEPIIYNGTTYLPVRAVANALGKEVYWDGPNFTVYLGSMGGKLEYPTVAIEDLTNIGDSISISNILTDNYGNSYTHAIDNRYGAYTMEHEFILNMKYSKFKGVLYVPKGESDDGELYLSIIADGKTIYTSPEISKSTAPIPIDLNINGCNNFKIKFSDTDRGWWNLCVCLGDAGFYQ